MEAAPAPPSDAPVAGDAPAAASREAPNQLDLVFCMDCTGSMGSYIESAKQNIESIVEKLVAYEKCDLRFGLVAYRDHPPQDSTYVTQVFDFVTSKRRMRENLNTMSAQGGGDGPEAVATGLHDTLHMAWRKDATKVAILISDAPPHGLGESGDGFPNGEPNGHDPIAIAREMARVGITVYTVGCEPAIQAYRFARAFLCSVAELTGGQAVSLSSSALLADVILGGAVEELGLQALMEEVQNEAEQAVAEASARGETLAEEDVSRYVTSKLSAKGVRTKQMKTNSRMLDSYSTYLTSSETLVGAKVALSSVAPIHDEHEERTERTERASRTTRRFRAAAAPMAAAAAPPSMLGSIMRRFSRSSATPDIAMDMEGAVAAAAPDDDATLECEELAPSPGFASAPAAAPSPFGMPEAPASFALSARSTPVREEVAIEEDAISYEQISRMVKKVNARKA